MKNRILLFLILCTNNVFAQDTLYDNTTIWIGKLNNGVRSGVWEQFKNDTLLSKGNFKNNIKEGSWVYYGLVGGKYPEMDTVAKGIYKNGKKKGLWEHYEGLYYWKGMYKDGLKQGVWNFYDLEVMGSPVMLKGSFVNDRPEGKWQFFYSDDETGISHLRAEGIMHKGYHTGTWKSYHLGSDNIRSLGSVDPDTSMYSAICLFDIFKFISNMEQLSGYYSVGLNKSGIWYYYQPNQQLEATGMYINGKKTGEWKYYHQYENATLDREGIYVNGRKEGEWRNYHYRDGSLAGIQIFTSDTLNGYCKYFNNNNATIEGAFAMGSPTGEWRKYYNDTILIEIGSYDGLFYPDYQQMTSLRYANLFSVNRHGYWKTFYSNNGFLREEGEYIHGKKIGQWREYASQGYLQSIKHYNNNILHGEYVHFNWHGEYVWHHGYYENGEKADWTEYEKGEGPAKEEYFNRNNLNNKLD